MGDTAKRKAGDDEGAKRAKRVEVKKDQGAAAAAAAQDDDEQASDIPEKTPQQRRLDALARILEIDCTCAAVTMFNGTLLIATNDFDSSTQIKGNKGNKSKYESYRGYHQSFRYNCERL